jgi:hypothetical protein
MRTSEGPWPGAVPDAIGRKPACRFGFYIEFRATKNRIGALALDAKDG